jgi:uncharacterized Tic20 family protein
MVVYLAKRDASTCLAEHARKALNFQIALSHLSIGLFITLICILCLWVHGSINFVLCIVAAFGRATTGPTAIRSASGW